LFLHLCPGINLSSHQKHRPYALLYSNSLLLNGLVVLMGFLLIKFGGGVDSMLSWEILVLFSFCVEEFFR